MEETDRETLSLAAPFRRSVLSEITWRTYLKLVEKAHKNIGTLPTRP